MADLKTEVEHLNELHNKILIKNKHLGQLQQIEDLKKAYHEKKLVLVLGAGISIEHGVPSWDVLLQNLLFEGLNSENESKKSLVLAKIFTKLFSPSPLIAARYVKNRYKRRYGDGHWLRLDLNGKLHQVSFNQAVKDIIYDGIMNDMQSELFKEIKQLCIPSRNGSILDSIITYNYDDILETYLSDPNLEIPHKSIFSPAIKHNDREIPIYHVHGFLPRNNEQDSEDIILSEDVYHEQYNEVLNWNNFIQINKFINFSCLFIGISFTDPNLRRLVDSAKNLTGRSDIQHYIIRKKINSEDTQRNLDNLLETDADLRDEKFDAKLKLNEAGEKLIELMENFQEKDAESFNIGTIWVNNYVDIPNILKELRS